MKLSAQEEYGLRCMLQLARSAPESMTVGEIAQREGLGESYAAKLLRLLREAGLLESVRGREGGYRLARPAEEVTVGEAVRALGGGLFYSESFCERFSGDQAECVHKCDCSLRSLWQGVDWVVRTLLDRCTLVELQGGEQDMRAWILDRLGEIGETARARQG
jgi:Rrf2 family protein